MPSFRSACARSVLPLTGWLPAPRSSLLFRKRQGAFLDPLADHGNVLSRERSTGSRRHALLLVLQQQPFVQLRILRPVWDHHLAHRQQEPMVQDLDAALGRVILVALITLLLKD